MNEIALNSGGGFDIAELTQKNTGEAIAVKASPISESAKKARLFLLSNNEVINSIPDKGGKESQAQKPNTIKRTTNRKHITFDGKITHCNKTYKINNGGQDKKYSLYIEPLKKIIEQFEIGLAKWNRVFVLRFDLHSPYETNDNKQMTAFRKRLFQKLKREYAFDSIGFCWAREYHGKGKGQHYHWAIWLDGNKIRHSSRINEMIKKAWYKPTGGYHVPTIKRPFYFVDNEEVAQDAIYRVSYLAKTRGKGYREEQTKDYQCSRMKP